MYITSCLTYSETVQIWYASIMNNARYCSCISKTIFCYFNYCSCLIGWEGESCDQCIRNPDCGNGYCYEPWQCICHGDWTGLNCNIGRFLF